MAKQVSKIWIYLTVIFGIVAIILFSALIHQSCPPEKQCQTLDYSQCVKTETKTVTNVVTKYQCNDGSIKDNLGDCPNPTSIKDFSGNSDAVTEPFYLNQGLAIIKLTYSGDSNFIVYIMDANGNKDNLANEIGRYSGTKTTTITQSGNYRFSVEIGTSYTGEGFSSTAPWTINVEQ